MRHSPVSFERIVSEAFIHPFLTISSEHERVAPRRFHCILETAIGSYGSWKRGLVRIKLAKLIFYRWHLSELCYTCQTRKTLDSERFSTRQNVTRKGFCLGNLELMIIRDYADKCGFACTLEFIESNNSNSSNKFRIIIKWNIYYH